jgi:hypothetical protein
MNVDAGKVDAPQHCGPTVAHRAETSASMPGFSVIRAPCCSIRAGSSISPDFDSCS